MRIVLVHGINNQGVSAAWIIEKWLAALGTKLSAADRALVAQQEIVAPYYGDVLYEQTEGLTEAKGQLTPQAAGDVEGDEAAFYRNVLTQVAKEAKIPQVLIDNAVDVVANTPGIVEQGPIFHNRNIIAIAQVIETISPFHGKVLLRVLPQAFVYLNRVQATKAVDDIVRPELEKGPCIVIAHSLGTIVTFKLMRQLKQVSPFYLTIGSPLAIQAVQGPIGTPFGRRPAVDRWLNVYDRDDFVTIGKPLDSTTFGGGIANVEVDNGQDDPHDFAMYLAHQSIADKVVAAIKAG